MKRREFITLLGGAAAAWPLAARAQQAAKCRHRVPRRRARRRAGAMGDAFAQRLRELGWIRAALLQSSIAGPRDAPNACRDRGRVRPAQGRCHRRRRNRSALAAKQATRSSRLSSRSAATRSAAGLVAVWRDRAATSPAVKLGADLAAKRLELLREIFPSLRRLAVLANGDQSRRVELECRDSTRQRAARP